VEPTQNKTYLSFQNRASTFESLLLRLAFILVTGFAVTNIGARALALTGTAQPNSFATYADIFPGKPASALEVRAISCRSAYNASPLPTGLYCTFTPTDGIFSSISVVILWGKIHQISFIVRENKLTVGDLELLFETRAVHKFPHSAYFALPSQGVFAMVYMNNPGQFSVLLPVRKISFTQTTLLGGH
jgi:hypothetical protein